MIAARRLWRPWQVSTAPDEFPPPRTSFLVPRDRTERRGGSRASQGCGSAPTAPARHGAHRQDLATSASTSCTPRRHRRSVGVRGQRKRHLYFLFVRSVVLTRHNSGTYLPSIYSRGIECIYHWPEREQEGESHLIFLKIRARKARRPDLQTHERERAPLGPVSLGKDQLGDGE